MLSKVKNNNQFIVILKNILLYFLMIFFCIFSSLPIKFFNNDLIFPNILLILIFYFLIINTEEPKYFTMFVLGLLVDVFNNYPFGTTSFIYLINARFILFLRKLFYTPNTFIIILRDFTLFSFFVEISQLLLFSIIDKQFYPLDNSFFQYIINLVFFIIMYKVLEKTKWWFI